MLKTIESKTSEQYIKDLSSANNEPEWLLKKRLAAYNIFKEKPMPNFIYGLNISMNIDLNLDNIDINNSGNSNLEIKNQNKDVIIENFEGMLKNHENILKEKFMSIVEANDKFTSFHNAFLNTLTFIYVPKNIEAKEPIELTSTIDSDVIFDHLIVFAEDNTKFTLVENSNNKNNNEKPINPDAKLINNKNNNLINNDGNKNIQNNNEIYRSKIVEIFLGNNAKMD